MSKDSKKFFGSYRGQLLDLARLYGIVEVKNYAKSNKRLTTTQLELLLIKNRIKLPENRSSMRAIRKQEIKENSITNAYLSICFLFLVAGLIITRPYIKNIVHEVKFTYVAQEYKDLQIKSEPPIEEEKIVKKTEDVIEKKEKIAKKETNIPKDKEAKIKYDNTVSLNVATTINLFEDLEYDLNNIRKGQKVKPVYFTKLPKDLKTLGNTSKKKEVFIKIVLPLILAENQKISSDRKKLFKILNKVFNTPGEKVWLKRRFKEYKVENSDLAELKTRMDVIPTSLALAQAAKESGWGTSRFALEGNALFGQWTWGKNGIVPLEKDPDDGYKILNFQILRASVRAYSNNLNTHKGYEEFREARAKLRFKNKVITGLDLTQYLERYAASGKEYIKVIELIIKQNSLTDFDKANLLKTRSMEGLSL